MDLTAYIGKPWKDCPLMDKDLTVPLPPKPQEYRPIRLLPRKDYRLYGEFPKLENKLLLECNRCGTVMVPSSFRSHCDNPDHDKMYIANNSNSTITSATKPTTSSKNNKPGAYIPPGTSLLKKKYQQPKNKKKSSLPPPVPPPPLFTVKTTPSTPSTTVTLMAAVPPDVPVITPAQQSSTPKPPSPQTAAPAVSTANVSAKHKKNKKSRKKSKEEVPAPEKVEKAEKPPTEYGPATKPPIIVKTAMVPPLTPTPKVKILQSIQLVPPRSVNKTQDIIECCPPIVDFKPINPIIVHTIPQKIAKVLPIKPTPKVKILQSIQLRPLRSILNNTQNNVETPSLVDYLPVTSTVNNVTVKKLVPITPLKPAPKVKVQQTKVQVVAPRSIIKTRRSVESPSTADYRPISPIISNVPLQFLQLPVLRVATQPLLNNPTQPMVVTIPIQNNSAPIYTTHPKPISITTRNMRKMGPSLLLQNQHIVNHRNEVQSLVNTRRTVINSLNSYHHRPNILKASARNNVKISVKRASSDKLLADNNKHIRLNDVNGFILHADVSESAEAPLHNNSVHDKVTFLNMK